MNQKMTPEQQITWTDASGSAF